MRGAVEAGKQGYDAMAITHFQDTGLAKVKSVAEILELQRHLHAVLTREEIGSYLGLKLETVSRLFSQFQRDGLIEVAQKHVRIVDIEGLERVLAARTH